MAAAATLSVLAAGAQKLGIGGKIKGLFGGGSNPNKGNSSLVDALDNYEAMSTTKAEMIAPTVRQMVERGASDREVALYISGEAGERSRVDSWMSSYKWRYVKSQVQQIRTASQYSRTSTGITTPKTRQVTDKSFSETAGDLFRLDNPFLYVFIGTLGLGGFFAYKNLK